MTFRLFFLISLLLSFGLGALSTYSQTGLSWSLLKKHEVVRSILKENKMSAVDTLRRHLLPTSHLEIVLVIMKEDKELVLYAGRPGTPFQQISQYKILSNDVIAGPKRQFDDGRIPEGFYYINRYEDLDSGNYRFGINYPNISDRKFSLADDLGKDVYIQTVHDSSGSICLAPASMNELTTFLIIACKSGQRKIPVYIFPFRMEDERCRERLNEISANTMQVVFWENMKSGYDLFMAKKQTLEYWFNEFGEYVFN